MDPLDQSHYDYVVGYMRQILSDIGVPNGARILDFGCGYGLHMRAYLRAGFDAYGCDVHMYRPDERISLIERSPYRLPYPDNHFDAVVSTSVLEHAQNTSELFLEIRRVLKPGGIAAHVLPTKWYLPSEPHIYVPLANYFWPRVPRWWLALWALIGVRNEYQNDMHWKEVVTRNAEYCRTGLAYRSCSEYERLSASVYEQTEWCMDTLLAHGEGGFASLSRKFPLKLFWSFVGRHFRMALLVQRTATPQPS